MGMYLVVSVPFDFRDKGVVPHIHSKLFVSYEDARSFAVDEIGIGSVETVTCYLLCSLSSCFFFRFKKIPGAHGDYSEIRFSDLDAVDISF